MILKRDSEFLSFSTSMLLQCVALFLGICAGLWIHIYCFFLVAGFTLIISVFGKPDSVYYHLFFCLPFAMIYKLSPASTSLFTYVMLAVSIVILIRQRLYSKKHILLIMLFAAYLVPGMGSEITTAIKLVVGLLLFYVFVARTEPENFKNHIMSFGLGMVGSSFLGLLKSSWPRLSAYYSNLKTININREQSFRFTGLYRDPNYYSISVILVIVLCVMLFINKDGNRIFLAAVIATLAVFGFTTYSKMFLLVAALLVFLFVLWQMRTPKKMAATAIPLLAAAGILYKWMQSSGYLSVMEKRLSGDDISTGRFGIWEKYMGYIFSSPTTLFLGDGLKAPYYSGVAPHNTYIELIFYIGVFGTIIFAVALISIFRSRKIIAKRTAFNYVLIVTFLGMSATLACFTVNDLMFYCMLMWMSMNINTDRKKGAISYEQ